MLKEEILLEIGPYHIENKGNGGFTKTAKDYPNHAAANRFFRASMAAVSLSLQLF